jgi:hypothetical protein
MEKNDSFRLISDEVAGAIIGGIVASLFLYDLTNRLMEKVFG